MMAIAIGSHIGPPPNQSGSNPATVLVVISRMGRSVVPAHGARRRSTKRSHDARHDRDGQHRVGVERARSAPVAGGDLLGDRVHRLAAHAGKSPSGWRAARGADGSSSTSWADHSATVATVVAAGCPLGCLVTLSVFDDREDEVDTVMNVPTLLG